MAEALAVAAVKEIASIAIDKLKEMAVSAAKEKLELVLGVREQIEKLSETLEMIKAVLGDAEKQQLTEEAVRVWLKRLKYVAYDAEDVLEEFAMEASRGPIGEEAPKGVAALIHWMKLVCDCLLPSYSTSPNPILFLHKIAESIKEISNKLDQITSESQRYNLQASRGTSLPEKRVETYSKQNEKPIGRKEEINIILNKLLGSSDKPESSSGSGGSKKVSLVAIVGMGGLGKTTLARAVFNDDRVVKEDQFPFRKWVFVGEKFDAKRLIQEIIGEKEDNLSLETLQYKLSGKLKSRKFLIVLDDVWSEESEEWKQLVVPLTCEEIEGKFIITTRSQKVVSAVGIHSSYSLMLNPLPDEDCRSIFEKEAFRDGKPNSPELREMGYQIVEKLKGIPLAVKVVGASLRNASDKSKWISVLNHKEGKLSKDKDDIMSVLRWSYHHLPSHLRQCFAYCSVFPKDHEFYKKDLVQMWMALNFIPSLDDEQMEDTGSSYFDDLLDRSFFQFIEYRYVMHDLMHDLAESISLEECLRIEGGKSNKNSGKVLHLSFSPKKGSELTEFQNMCRYNKSRSLIHVPLYTYVPFTAVPFTVLRDLFVGLKCIRVLDLSQSGIKEIPNSISELVHLRYLDLSYNQISHLPEKLCSLCNLQTFKIEGNYIDSLELPKGISKLNNLRCIKADSRLISKIDGLGKLSSLREIGEDYYIFREGSRSNIVELENLNQLRGRLGLHNLKNVVSGEEAGPVMLQEKKYIDSLTLTWGYNDDMMDDSNGEAAERIIIDEKVLEVLQPPAHLQRMFISGNRGVKYPTWMASQLSSNLVSFELYDCKWEALPTTVESNNCASLFTLRIVNCPNLISLSESGFVNHSSLSELWIERCPKLTTTGLQRVPALETLWISKCDALLSVWAEEGNVDFTSLKTLEIRNCRELISLSESGFVNHSSLSKLVIRECPKLTTTGLQRVPALETLWIRDCDALLSVWAEEGNVDLTSLKSLQIKKCRELVCLWDGEDPTTTTRGLFSLKSLEIMGCPKLRFSPVKDLLESITSSSSDFSPEEEEERGQSSSSSSPPLLQKVNTDNRSLLAWLLQNNLPSLERMTIDSCDEQLQRLTSLQKLRDLTVRGCHELRSLSVGLQSLSSLETLVIEDCNQIQNLQENVLPNISLRELEIKSCGDLAAVPPWLQCLPSRVKMRIEDCNEIRSLQGDSLPVSLQQLRICECSALRSVKLQSLSSLKKITIADCREIQSLSEDSLPVSLQELSIYNCSALQSLPAGLQSLSSLKKICIYLCPQILSLPCLPVSLQELTIYGCPALQSLPEKTLPTSLQFLNIKDCPKLEEWCRVEGIPYSRYF